MPLFRKHSLRSLAALLAIVISAAALAPASAQDAEAQVNLAAALDDACVIGLLSPQRIVADKNMELLPWELVTAAGVMEFGVDPLKIARVFVFVKTPENLDRPPLGGFMVQLTEPADVAAIVKATGAEALPGDGTKVYQTAKMPLVFAIPNPTTIVAVSDPGMLEAILTTPAERPAGPLVDLLQQASAGHDAAVVISVEKLRPLLKAKLADAPQLPPPMEKLKQLPDLIDTITVRAKATEGGAVGLRISAVDDASADELEKIANYWLEVGQEMALTQIQSEIRKEEADDPFAAAMLQYTQRVSGKVMDALRPKKTGSELVFFEHGEGLAMNGMASNAVLVGLLLPALQAAREAARRSSSVNSMKQINLALHNYADTHGKLPSQASYDANGKPLLSWRVHILPYIEQQALYQQFHLDEPWDSEHNLKLAETIVPVYQSPNLNPSNKTVYLAVAGQGMIMDGNKQRRFQDILDGTSNTIWLVEANEDQAVVWTKPQDLPVDLEDPLKGLGRLRPGIFNAGLLDGSVKAISVEIDKALLKAMFTIAGGEVVPVQ